MPSAANGKTEKQPSSEAADNSPVRQIMTVVEHKIRNLEKRKSKLTSYRDLQKAGKELNADQKVAVAKYDEVAQTLEFARDLSKQISGIAITAEKEMKKQAKKEAWVRYASETTKIRDVLLILDCLMQMGTPDVRDDFLNGTNGAPKLTDQDLKILDDLYPEVTPKHELNEEGQPGFVAHVAKAADILYSITEGRPKEVLGTTYTHIKQIVTLVQECGYFDKPLTAPEPEVVEEEEVPAPPEEEVSVVPVMPEPTFPPATLPPPPIPAVLPQPGYPLRAMPPITLQEVEHAYFAQQYPQQRPITEVIGSQNFFFLQESELDSPVGTPGPAMVPTQTFTNQQYVEPQLVPQMMPAMVPTFASPPPPAAVAAPPAAAPPAWPDAPPAPPAAPVPAHTSPERKPAPSSGQGDAHHKYRRGRGGARPPANGYRGRGNYHNRDNYHRHNEPAKDNYRQYNNSEYRNKEKYHRSGDAMYGNGDSAREPETNGRERRQNESYSGYKPRPRPSAAADSKRPARAHAARNDNGNAP